MGPFKVGDLVECIEGWGDRLITGRTHRVSGTRVGLDGQTLIELDGNATGWYTRRFKLVSEFTTPTPVRDTQIGGAHYHTMGIQPYEYSLANNLGALEHTAIKYVSRWRKKNGIEDLKKAIHTIQYLIEYTEKNGMPE